MEAVDTLHEPENSSIDFQILTNSRFMVTTRVKNLRSSLPMNPHPGPLPSDGRGRVFGRLAGKVAAGRGSKREPSLGGILSPALSFKEGEGEAGGRSPHRLRH